MSPVINENAAVGLTAEPDTEADLERAGCLQAEGLEVNEVTNMERMLADLLMEVADGMDKLEASQKEACIIK